MFFYDLSYFLSIWHWQALSENASSVGLMKDYLSTSIFLFTSLRRRENEI